MNIQETLKNDYQEQSQKINIRRAELCGISNQAI